MNLSDQSFEQFVNLTYEALEDPAKWRSFYEQLSQAIGTDSIHMLAFDKRHGTLSYSDGANLPVQGELAYIQKYRYIDPRMPMIMANPVHGWVHCHEELDEDFVAKDPFYQEFLIPYDRRYMSACKLLDDTDSTIIIAILSSPARGPLQEQSIAFLNRLLPHISRACRLGVQNFIYSTQALVGHTLVNKLRQPVILMTTTGEVIKTNEAANRLLQTADVIAVREGRLSLPEPYLQNLLEKCAEMESRIKKGNSEGNGEGSGEETVKDSHFHSLQIRQPGESEEEVLYAFFTMLVPQEVMGTFGLRPMVMIFLYHPTTASAIDPDLLYAVFGLTPAESRVAVMLAEGAPLKQIAAILGVQHETVRKQLQSIYQKTSTNRQPELIRLLLNLPHNILQD